MLRIVEYWPLMVGSQPSIVRSKSDLIAAKCFKIGNITNKLANSFLCMHFFTLDAMFCDKNNYFTTTQASLQRTNR